MKSTKKRKSLKSILSVEIILFVAIIIIVITGSNVKIQSDKITELTESVISKESISYSNEIYNWWSGIESRVMQTSTMYRSLKSMQFDDTLDMLLKLTAEDPDAQDIYMAFGKTGRFLDGSGWVPDDSFVFTDRAWYKGAIAAGGEIYTSDPYIDASTGKTCLACAILVKDDIVLSCDITFDKVEEKMKEFMMLGFRKTEGPSLEGFREMFGKNYFDIFKKELDGSYREGLVCYTGNDKDLTGVKLTDKGLDLANQVFMKFV